MKGDDILVNSIFRRNVYCVFGDKLSTEKKSVVSDEYCRGTAIQSSLLCVKLSTSNLQKNYLPLKMSNTLHVFKSIYKHTNYLYYKVVRPNKSHLKQFEKHKQN